MGHRPNLHSLLKPFLTRRGSGRLKTVLPLHLDAQVGRHVRDLTYVYQLTGFFSHLCLHDIEKKFCPSGQAPAGSGTA